MSETRRELESQLNDFNVWRRREALEGLMDLAHQGKIKLPKSKHIVNLHCHTFFSFNGYGYSPSCIAWKARCDGWAVAGIVDFDVLDAVDEFLEACRIVGIRGCAGIETRVYVPQFATREINSPGEPGVTYHMGMGFTSSKPERLGVLPELKRTAQARNRGILERVNPFLDLVALSYEDDVLPLAPNGNPTERHICMAYDEKSRAVFPNEDERAAFWASKLGGSPEDMKAKFKEPPVFQGVIRSKTMKAGGVGYVKPEGPDFPALERVNDFVLDASALPVFAWLNGLTEGELAIEELLDLMMEAGAVAVNIIPDRNWNLKDPEQKRKHVAKLHEMVALAQARALPLIVGTEMNAYGQPFVDNFAVPEMAPLVEPALEGAYILYAHTLLHSANGMGYLSEWSRMHFADGKSKNAFFAKAGRSVSPEDTQTLTHIGPSMKPPEVLAAMKSNS